MFWYCWIIQILFDLDLQLPGLFVDFFGWSPTFQESGYMLPQPWVEGKSKAQNVIINTFFIIVFGLIFVLVSDYFIIFYFCIWPFKYFVCCQSTVSKFKHEKMNLEVSKTNYATKEIYQSLRAKNEIHPYALHFFETCVLCMLNGSFKLVLIGGKTSTTCGSSINFFFWFQF